MNERKRKDMDDSTKKKPEWCSSTSPLWPGEMLSSKVVGFRTSYVSSNHTEHVFETRYGRDLQVDGTTSCVRSFGSAYYEMITHLPLCSHAKPEKVLIIGDKNQRIMQEVCRHKPENVKEIHVSSKDEMVAPVSSVYFYKKFPDANRVKYHDCSVEELLEKQEFYDAIIVDPVFPIVPNETAFDRPFYDRVARALRRGGVFCTRVESHWFGDNMVKRIEDMFSKIFTGSVKYAWAQLPMFPNGVASFVLCSSGSLINFKEPANPIDNDPNHPLKLYDPKFHYAPFVIPPKFQ